MGTDDRGTYSGPERRTDGWVWQRLVEIGEDQVELRGLIMALRRELTDLVAEIRQDRDKDEGADQGVSRRLLLLERWQAVEDQRKKDQDRFWRIGFTLLSALSLVLGIILAVLTLRGQIS